MLTLLLKVRRADYNPICSKCRKFDKCHFYLAACYTLFGKTSMTLITNPLAFAVSHLLQEDKTVPGTTDGILLMGILIVLLVVLPIVWTRREWMK